MAAANLLVTVTFAWWFWPYMHATLFFASIAGRQPDERKFMRMIELGMRLKVV